MNRFFNALSRVTPICLWLIFPFLESLFPSAIPQIKPMLMWIFATGLLFICLIIQLILEREEKKLFDEHISADCKMFFDVFDKNGTITADFETVLNEFSGVWPNIRDELGSDRETWAVWKDDPNDQKRIEAFIDGKTPALSTLKCRKIFSGDKAGKCFIQCMFVPLDGNNDTLRIKRLDAFHPTLYSKNKSRAGKCAGKRSENTFISFSPIPDHFGQAFDPIDAYHREVNPASGVEPEVRFHGLVLRKIGAADAGKNQSPASPHYFLMLVYSVKYDVLFSQQQIAAIFSSSSQARRGNMSRLGRFWHKLFHNTADRDKPLYFEKDHDDIVGSISWKDLNRTVYSSGDGKENPLDNTAEEEIIKYFYNK